MKIIETNLFKVIMTKFAFPTINTDFTLLLNTQVVQISGCIFFQMYPMLHF